MRTILASTGIFIFANTALAQTPVLVKDINPGIFSGILSTPDAVVIGSTLYFTAGISFDEELWKSDGTVAGTLLVKDIRVGSASAAFGEYPMNLMIILAPKKSCKVQLYTPVRSKSGYC